MNSCSIERAMKVLAWMGFQPVTAGLYKSPVTGYTGTSEW